MKTMKMNSIGFSYSKNIRLGEGLIAVGLVLVSIGLLTIIKKQQWIVASTVEHLDHFERVYKSFT